MLLALLLATYQSTRCATVDIAVGLFVDRQLVGCGPQFTDNVLWNLDRADGSVDGQYTRRTTGAGAVVYVVDTGLEVSHDEFQRGGGTNVIAGLDPYAEVEGGAACGDSPTHPCYRGPYDAFALTAMHGTAVASIVAGRTTGVAPEASIVSVRVFGLDMTHRPLELFNRALDDIVKHAFDPATPFFQTAVVNMSASPGARGNEPEYAEFERKMRLMIGGVDKDFHADPSGKKFLFVVLAGNNTAQPSHCTPTNEVATYPALAGPAIDGLITVGGFARDNSFWSGSCGGGAIEILGPAEQILSASYLGHDQYRGSWSYDPATPHDYSSGTSYATPYVSGIAARMLQASPWLTPAELEQRIKATAVGQVAALVDAPQPPRHRAAAH
jgi:subtilisin family serine protease